MFTTRTSLARVALGASAFLVVGQFAAMSAASAEPQAAPTAAATFVDLGKAASYSILSGAGVANTGAGTVLSGNLGLSPSGAIAGFPPGTVNGTIHDKDTAAENAQADREAAYADALGQTSTDTFAGDQAGKTFKPGVHTIAAAFTNTGTVTLDADGDSSAVFIFQVGAAFSSAAASKVVLTDGALANNVFWQVTGAVSLGAGAKLVGTFLGFGAITFGDGASIKGRVLTPGTVAVTNSPFTEPVDDLTAPVVTIQGGATRSTSDTTPPISGTTGEALGTAVTVTVAGQTLHTWVDAGGVWRVSAGELSPGSHHVVASVTDASRNTGTADQTLTVDVTAPAVSIDGGATTATKDTTPTISGTTDAPADTTVTVKVAQQTLTTTVSDAGTWSVDAARLTEDSHLVVATVDDAAHNTGTANQVLTVDVTVPVVTINGGATRSTTDTSPWIYGTTAEKAGTKVRVTIGTQHLTATVRVHGAWGVSAKTLPAGAHQVVAAVTDAAHNRGTATQTLTITGGEPAARYQPDGAIRPLHGSYVGAGVYDVDKQRVTTALRGSTKIATFQVRLTNRGNTAEQLTISGTPRTGAFRVTYLDGGHNVTTAVTAGTYLSSRLAPGAAAHLVVKVTRTSASSDGDRRRFAISASSSHVASARDTVAALVRVV